MSLPTISPTAAKQLIDRGAMLIDIRGADEFAREHIAGARNLPIDQLTSIPENSKPVVFHCKSGNRTSVNAGKLATVANCEAYIVEGGIEAWKGAGLPVIADRKQPIEIMRQVQIVAGSLVILGVVLSQVVDPAFMALPAFIGAGLTFAGLTGWCGMAKLLAVLPWNRPSATSA